MFDYIKGELVFIGENTLVVENNGIGYLILSNARTLSLMPDIGLEVKIYTKLVHKEDSMTLVGFKQKEDRVIFDILTSVSGIGTKVALILLDEFSGSELIDYVINEDYKSISRAKGVGVKLAQKIIIELKGKLTSAKTNSEIILGKFQNSPVQNDILLEVQTILQSLGYNRNEYTSAIQIVLQRSNAKTSEEILKEALQLLSNT
ncbi:MAG: Holliday junction branch migration protein RuvA [Candidatus Gastranaerophilales bacterium]|nr:Holliday junction branch migration protein RuvA [Candidatus Gastranaerophilales bacterium]